ncbi:MAG TPA: hypothetical protein PLG59_17255, partial [bacterium]|nr:hypothetical protein [bacterium]
RLIVHIEKFKYGFLGVALEDHIAGIMFQEKITRRDSQVAPDKDQSIRRARAYKGDEIMFNCFIAGNQAADADDIVFRQFPGGNEFVKMFMLKVAVDEIDRVTMLLQDAVDCGDAVREGLHPFPVSRHNEEDLGVHISAHLRKALLQP